ncbi:MAG: methyltransferase domain-containing protein [Verrucomicrobiota bacterium JB023]|nr:methyltransferase domain-containing protein [Verrucomicrobiota bacterium JB023]
MSQVVDTTRTYYDSTDADQFYFHIWGGEDIHIGLYEEGETDTRAASRRTVKAMADQLSHLPAGSRILDIGSGYGGSGRYLIKEHGFEVTSLNLSEVQNERNRAANVKEGVADKHEVVAGNFEEIPFADETFDAVWSQDAILHSGDRFRVFQEVDRVLKPGGGFIFTDPMQKHNADPEALAPVLQRIHLASMGSFETYDEYRNKLGWEEVSVDDLTPQLVQHYTAVRANLKERRGTLAGEVSEAYIDNMIQGLSHWIVAGGARLLAWGILHYRKA